MIEAIGAYASDINHSRKTRSQEQHGNVTLMACVLKTCDLGIYVDTHGRD